MKALFFDEKANVRNIEVPELKEGESLIKIQYVAICNTDREIMRGYKGDFKGVMGHEFVGTVMESHDERLIGKNVVSEINISCGECLYCKTGREIHCDNRRVIGIFDYQGCFAEYIVVPTRLLHIVPDNIDIKKAVYAEPLAAAFRIAELIHIKAGEKVAVVGDGRLAFMCAQIVHLLGADLTVIGKHDEKLDMFKDFAKIRKLSEKTEDIPKVIEADESEMNSAIATGIIKDEYEENEDNDNDNSETYEKVIEATGNQKGLEIATKLVRKQGTIAIKSTYADLAVVDMSYYVVNEITLTGSRCGPFGAALSLMSTGKINLPEIKYYKLEEFEEAFSDKESFKTGFTF